MKLETQPAAEREGVEAADWYDAHRAGLGDEFFAELHRTLDRIQHSSRSLPLLDDYSGRHEIRYCPLRRFPYMVIFRCQPDIISIIAVSHIRRRLLHWLERLE